MRLLTAIGVVIAARLFGGWPGWFETVCGGVILAVLVLALWASRCRARAVEIEEDVVFQDIAEDSSTGRELVIGFLIGIAWTVVTFAGTAFLRHTPVYGWFTDVPGEALLREVEVLMQNRAWESVDVRLQGPLPAHIRHESKDKLNRLRYDALLHLAAPKADAEARCAASRKAESFARSHGIDPEDSALASLANCASGQARRELPPGAHVVPVVMTTDDRDHSVVRAMVLDSAGNAVSGLEAKDFVAIVEGRAVPVVQVVYEPERTEARRFAIVLDTRGVSIARMRRVQSILAFLAGMMRLEDESELILCRKAGVTRSGFARGGIPLLGPLPPPDSSEASDLPACVRTAVAELSRKAGDIVVLRAGQVTANTDDLNDLAFLLTEARIPVHVVGIFPVATGPGSLRQLARASGGLDIEIANQRIEGLRDRLAGPIEGKGAYLITLDRRIGSLPATGLTALTRQGSGGLR
jgi:hypothetical protein